jgi:hypothetical protein
MKGGIKCWKYKTQIFLITGGIQKQKEKKQKKKKKTAQRSLWTCTVKH